MRASILTLLILFCGAGSSLAAKDSGFIRIGANELYVQHKPAARNASTIVLLNGLTYSTREWTLFASALNRLSPDSGVLRYDMKGMGKTLLNDPLPVDYAISHSNQVDDLKALLDKLGLKKVELVGLSYGGGIGIAFAKAYPNYVSRLILMAPFTEALEDQDKMIKRQIQATRIAFPYNPASDDELYDFFLRHTIYTTYPLAEPIVLENPFKLEAVFRMVQGIRRFKAEEVVKNFPQVPVHLMVANQDQYIPQSVMDRFWAALPDRNRASRINISRSEHKMPEAIPGYGAAWVMEILKNPDVADGKIFDGNAQHFRAKSGELEISLPRP